MDAMRPSEVASPEVKVPHAFFEGLFQRALHPDAALWQALGEAGYDPRGPHHAYPVGVWQACVAAARRHRFGELPEAEAQRRLGWHLAEGFLHTLMGRMAGAALHFVGPGKVVDKLPRAAGHVGGVHMPVVVEALGPRARRVRFGDPFNHPEFTAGALEHALERTRARPHIDVEAHAPGQHYTLRVRW